MKKTYIVILYLSLYVGVISAQSVDKDVVINTNVGTLKVKLYGDVPNHTVQFIKRATQGNFNGTLFTRIIKEFMIQGGASDSRNAPAGGRCGYGDKNAEIDPELNTAYFHKKGALAAPRQPDEVNPQKKSDVSQFFIVHGKVYRSGELDTLELLQNMPIKKKALSTYYVPAKLELAMLKRENPREYNKRLSKISAQVDSVIRATPGHLLFTEAQRTAYTTGGGCPHLDGIYTIFGEVTEGLELIDLIANQPKDQYDRPKKDIRILSVQLK